MHDSGGQVRASIVCDTLEQVTQLLAIIAAESSVEILSGKQRLTNAYSGADTGGYCDCMCTLT